MCLRARWTSTLMLSALLALTVCAGAHASFVLDRNTELVGYDTLQHLSLYSLVTVDAGIYTYSYDLRYDAGTVASAEVFSVANWEDLGFYGAANGKDFQNPAYSPGDLEIKWIDGHITMGETVHFSYQSVYAPSEIEVYAYAVDGGAAAEGSALGMTTAVPEPSSLAGLALAAFGVVPLLRRRK